MLEICVDTPEGADAAIAGGADRLELCAALALGGLTPQASLVRYVATAPIPVHLLARPRDGNFRYSAVEAEMVADDIRLAAEAGLAGAVIGANDAEGDLDTGLLARWVAHAKAEGEKRGRPLSLTLHRAFDLCKDLPTALDSATALGFDRVLTSGGQPKAVDARDMLATLVQRARGRIEILAGSGVNPSNVRAILSTGVREVHASCRSASDVPSEAEMRFGFQNGPTLHTDPKMVAQLREVVRGG